VSDANAAWGWKNSGSVHLLRFLHDEFPSVRFLHLVRDRRDMAYSPNQYQVRHYGNVLLTPEGKALEPAVALDCRVESSQT
jgi:hypothetical protein